MNSMVDSLFDQYDCGRMTRRHLVQALAALVLPTPALAQDGARMVQKLKSRCLTIVVVEHSAEPLVSSYSAVHRRCLQWNDETIVESLMIPFQMIMRHKLSY